MAGPRTGAIPLDAITALGRRYRVCLCDGGEVLRPAAARIAAGHPGIEVPRMAGDVDERVVRLVGAAAA